MTKLDHQTDSILVALAILVTGAALVAGALIWFIA